MKNVGKLRTTGPEYTSQIARDLIIVGTRKDRGILRSDHNTAPYVYHKFRGAACAPTPHRASLYGSSRPSRVRTSSYAILTPPEISHMSPELMSLVSRFSKDLNLARPIGAGLSCARMLYNSQDQPNPLQLVHRP